MPGWLFACAIGALAIATSAGLLIGLAHWRATDDGTSDLAGLDRQAAEEALRLTRFYCIGLRGLDTVPRLLPTRALRVKSVRQVFSSEPEARRDDPAGALLGYEVEVEALAFFSVPLGDITLRGGSVNCHGGPA